MLLQQDNTGQGTNNEVVRTLSHIDDLIRHIELVRRNGVLLGKRLIERGEEDLGRLLIGNVYKHDVSKFYGIEWEFLHQKDVAKEDLDRAIKQHQSINPHHAEYWGDISRMPRLYLCEMVCDWLARSQEFGTCLRDWVKVAIPRYNIGEEKEREITNIVDLLLETSWSSE
jgi:hypothetical protein